MAAEYVLATKIAPVENQESLWLYYRYYHSVGWAGVGLVSI